MRLIDRSKDEWEVGKVTARREKGLSELGIARETFAPEGEAKPADQIVEEILTGGGEKLNEFIKVLFVGREILPEELEDIDKTEVKRGVMSFFLSDLELMEGYSNLLTTLGSLKSPGKKPEL